MIPYGKQSLNEADIDAVVKVLRSDFITQGPKIQEFEKAMADYCGVRFSVAVSSATAALHLACASLGVDKNSRVWTSPNTFVASANCALFSGATIDFVDIEDGTRNLSVAELRKKISSLSRDEKPNVLIPVHFGGHSCEMRSLRSLADEHGFSIIEDASHAIGGAYEGKHIGNCEFSDATVFSFHPVKLMTTGEGGMITTNREDLYEKLIRLRSHGITRNRNRMNPNCERQLHELSGDLEDTPPEWYYQQIDLGWNFRITDIQAALGLSQFRRLNEFVRRRNELAGRYNTLLADLPVEQPEIRSNCYSAFHLYPIVIKESVRVTRRDVFKKMRQKGIGVQIHYIPVHTQPFYRRLGFQLGDFPRAEAYYARTISLPLFYDLTESEQDYVVGSLAEAIAR